MSEKPWAHLPNAKHIDAVLADVNVRPEAWDTAWTTERGVAWDTAWYVARNAAWIAARDAAWIAARDAAWGAAWDTARTILQGAAWYVARGAVRDTLSALIAWDDSADLLDYTPDVLRAMIDLAEPPVCHQAALLLPYAIVRSNAKQEVT